MSTKPLDLTGQQFGMLTALSRLPEKENGYFKWDCKCTCGGNISVSTKRLKRGTVTNCGCIPKDNTRNGPLAEDITGKKFGKLTALRRTESKGEKTHWICSCECGRIRSASTSMLKSGRTWHCGCMRGKTLYNTRLDLQGKRFGRLVATRITEKRNSKGSIIWECICDCGKVVEIPSELLVSGNTTSCGCRKQEIKDTIRDSLTFVDGTCVEWLRSRKHRSDNTSGFRGVCKTKEGKWRVSIGFKRKRYNIGKYDNFEAAKAARLCVEKIIHDDFVLAWDKWCSIAQGNQEWADGNPFVFDVYKNNGKFCVHAPILADDYLQSVPDSGNE